MALPIRLTSSTLYLLDLTLNNLRMVECLQQKPYNADSYNRRKHRNTLGK